MDSMLNSKRVTGQIDDDMLHRLIQGIEQICNDDADDAGRDPEISTVDNVDWAMSVAFSPAYKRVRDLLIEAYPDMYTRKDE